MNNSRSGIRFRARGRIWLCAAAGKRRPFWEVVRQSNRCSRGIASTRRGRAFVRATCLINHGEPAAGAAFRIVAGPDARSNPALDGGFWANKRFRVGTRHDRKGLRLEGDYVSVASDPERLSTPVAPGAVQVAGGQLIVLGVASGTMGGYPHVAHLVSADLDRLGQLKAGDVIRFEYVTIEEARRLLLAARSQKQALIRRVGLMSQDA